MARDKERVRPLNSGLGPWYIDRLRRPDNGGGNGVCASRRYVLLDRQAARAGGRAHLSLPVPGEPCLPASGTLQNDLPGLLVDSVRAMLSVKEARSSSCRRATCLLSIVGSTHPHVQISLAAKRICTNLLILDPALSRSVGEQDGCSQTVAAHLHGQCRRVPGLRRGGSVGPSDRSLGCQTPEHAPCDEATSGIKAVGALSSRPALCPGVAQTGVGVGGVVMPVSGPDGHGRMMAAPGRVESRD